MLPLKISLISGALTFVISWNKYTNKHGDDYATVGLLVGAEQRQRWCYLRSAAHIGATENLTVISLIWNLTLFRLPIFLQLFL